MLHSFKPLLVHPSALEPACVIPCKRVAPASMPCFQIVHEIRDRREHLEALEALGPVSEPLKRGLLNDIGQRLSELRTLGVAAGPPQC